MTRRSLLAFTLTASALVGVVGYETYLAQQQDEPLRVLRRQAPLLARETSALLRERDTLARDLAEAERQLAALPPLRPAAPEVSPERHSEMKAWLARVKRLHRLFDERPDQRIPEMQFLTEEDWLRVAKDIQFDSDETTRHALAALRTAAAEKFTPQLTAALRNFAKNPPENPPTILALERFADPPIDPGLLVRYELSKTTETPPRWKVQTKAPVDADYDTRHYVDVYVDGRSNGRGSMNAPTAWIPDFQQQAMRAYQAYAKANNGASPQGLTEVLPYFNPPLSFAHAEKLIKAEREQKR